MGKWAEVECDCTNRIPLPRSRIRPHENKRHLTKKEQEEVQEWERTTEDMYECGHRYGVLLELAPDDIVQLGHHVGRAFEELEGAFEVFPRVGDWRSYGDDELLLIPPDEAAIWLLEIEELQSALDGAGSLPRERVEQLVMNIHLEEESFKFGLWRPKEEVKTWLDSAYASWMQEGYGYQRPEAEPTMKMIRQALAHATMLCQASFQTGNPVKMMW